MISQSPPERVATRPWPSAYSEGHGKKGNLLSSLKEEEPVTVMVSSQPARKLQQEIKILQTVALYSQTPNPLFYLSLSL